MGNFQKIAHTAQNTYFLIFLSLKSKITSKSRGWAISSFFSKMSIKGPKLRFDSKKVQKKEIFWHFSGFLKNFETNLAPHSEESNETAKCGQMTPCLWGAHLLVSFDEVKSSGILGSVDGGSNPDVTFCDILPTKES